MTGKSTREQLYHFVDDLQASLQFEVGRVFECDHIILCGVGGSAVSGDFVSDCCLLESTKCIRSMKYPDLPNWVGSKTLAIISSYSGNTAETIEMYNQAKNHNCVVAVLTSGGTLRGLAEFNEDYIALLPEGMHPRHAIGFMIGYTLKIIEATGAVNMADRMAAIIPRLKEYRDDRILGNESFANVLAKRMEGKVPVICSDSSMQSVAFRWKTQINENSKFVAFCESSPGLIDREMNNLGDNVDPFLFVFLDNGCSGIADAARKAEIAGVDSVHIKLKGESNMENMFRAIILGDYTSIIMAENRGIDSAEVRPVMQMKAKLAELHSVH